MKELEKQNKALQEEVAKLKNLIKKVKEKKKYGLVWDSEKEPEGIVLDCQYKVPILKEISSKRITSEEESPINILIEGDNYHALSILNYTHKGKIDLIYIDPPYNTGKKTWKYNNHYVDKEDLYKHSQWINFMKNRLVAAKDLLTEKGALICAIDENEHATLGLLLQQIFINYVVDCITIVHNPRGIQGDNFAYCHEYAYFVYPKNGKYIGRKIRSDDEKDWSNLRNWGGESTREDGKSLFYPIYFKDNKLVKIGTVPSDSYHPPKAYKKLKNGMIEIWPIDNNGIERKWRYSRETLSEIIDLIRLEEVDGVLQAQILKVEDRYKTVWTDKKYDANTWGTQLLKEILGKNKKFPFPKSLFTVKECLDAVAKDNKNAVVLDYFAGSGTTAHAVLEMNKEDGGHRSFILATNNEDNDGDGVRICSDICYPRIKNVMEGYKYEGQSKKVLYNKKLTPNMLEDNKSTIEEMATITSRNNGDYDEFKKKIEDDHIKLIGITNIKGKKEGLGGNMRYYQSELIDVDHISHVSDDQRIKLTYLAGEMIAMREGVYDEIEKNEWWQIFRSGNRCAAIYFKENKVKLIELVKKLAKYKNEVALYIFSWGKNEYKNEYSEYKNLRVEDIPEPIIDVYKGINKL
ncbi:MAG: site-specific DNA-methyltransferase [Candidatus Saganbacteria bacterium]|nr:site-specific DNA-methyltransferase [Candidatus Saganbacteria bacterium]